ncbi:MAG: inositol monophosphatase family protein [Candidatus Riflebacteria bacterium]|nr:inositol monophosphatase family protein [Candidatus Riflebacteria bacterium]
MQFHQVLLVFIRNQFYHYSPVSSRDNLPVINIKITAQESAMHNLETLARGAVEVATQAAELISQSFEKSHQIIHKGAVDLVTEVDTASEQLIKKELHARFPKIRFHGEENGGDDWRTGEVWVVDPLDGTTNFANRLGHFAVSIALCNNGTPIAGAIVNPINHETYHCWLGGGAFLNGAPIKTGNQSSLNDTLAVTGFPYNRRENLDVIMERLKIILMHVQCVRRLGSAALDLCHIARGVFGVYWETNLKPWDIAAGSLLVTEAGGRVSRLDGSQMQLDSLELLATNGILHQNVIDLLAPTL